MMSYIMSQRSSQFILEMANIFRPVNKRLNTYFPIVASPKVFSLCECSDVQTKQPKQGTGRHIIDRIGCLCNLTIAVSSSNGSIINHQPEVRRFSVHFLQDHRFEIHLLVITTTTIEREFIESSLISHF
jgi:hypothetical protein